MYQSRAQQFNELTQSKFSTLMENSLFVPCGPYCILLTKMPHYNEQIDFGLLELGIYVNVLILTESGEVKSLRPRFYKKEKDLIPTVKKILDEAPKDLFLGDWKASRDSLCEVATGQYLVEQYFDESMLYTYIDDITEKLCEQEFPFGGEDIVAGTLDQVRLFTKEDVQVFIKSGSTKHCFATIPRVGEAPAPTSLDFLSFDMSNGFTFATGKHKGEKVLFGNRVTPRETETILLDRANRHIFTGAKTNDIFAVATTDIYGKYKIEGTDTEGIMCEHVLEVSNLFTDTIEDLLFTRKTRRHI